MTINEEDYPCIRTRVWVDKKYLLNYLPEENLMSGYCGKCGEHTMDCNCAKCAIDKAAEDYGLLNPNFRDNLHVGFHPKMCGNFNVSLGDKSFSFTEGTDNVKLSEAVNHPDHYQGNTIEAIDIIEDFGLNFCLGNAIKYILRCEKKGRTKEDLRKAIWYLERELSNYE